MVRYMAQVLGNVQVKEKLLIKPLCHRYFPQLAFTCSNSTIETLETLKTFRNTRTRCEICSKL